LRDLLVRDVRRLFKHGLFLPLLFHVQQAADQQDNGESTADDDQGDVEATHSATGRCQDALRSLDVDCERDGVVRVVEDCVVVPQESVPENPQPLAVTDWYDGNDAANSKF